MPNQSSFAAGHVESGPQCSGAPALTEMSVPVELSAAGPSSLACDGEMARQKEHQAAKHAKNFGQCYAIGERALTAELPIETLD